MRDVCVRHLFANANFTSNMTRMELLYEKIDWGLQKADIYSMFKK
jgi:hypothetical protein